MIKINHTRHSEGGTTEESHFFRFHATLCFALNDEKMRRVPTYAGITSNRVSHPEFQSAGRHGISGSNRFRNKFGMTVLLFILFTATTFAQNLTNVEYFFDVDPGAGSAMPLTIPGGQTNFDITDNLTQGLAAGMHVLSVRAKDDNGNWGFAERRSFYIPANSTTDPPIADITAMEYFIDDDPGYGGGTTIVISSGSLVDLLSELIEITDLSLSAGFHTIYIRTKNVDNVWGFTEARAFFIPPGTTTDPAIAAIDAMEYYIDTDPGVGSATTIGGASGSVVDFPAITVDANALLAGFHTLGIRARNTDNVWGFEERREFYIVPGTSTDPSIADMVKMEYFFDTDPGFGAATDLSITSGAILDISPLIPESLSAGYHHFFIRSKNADNTWGITESRVVYVKPTVATSSLSDITKMEYYFDGNDPGVGNADDLPIVAGPLVDLNTVDVPTSPTLIDGQHEITFRAQNADGVWGVAETTTFDVLDDCTQPITGFTPQLACAGQTVTFTDTSTNLQGDAQYRWYLNGDNIIDATTVGDATFTYDVPGIYVVALAIRQGTICLDSIATTITIQPEPVAVFSTTGTLVNEPTNFTASANNMPVGATWEWDFDGDLSVDDNTVGATSFTYTTENTFNPILTITDGLGCKISVTNPITISSSGGGGTSPPSASFLPENGCVGNAISFIDLSQNIPASSTYSWDFDGDGNEDGSTVGSTSFIYPSSGSFIAKLSINTGSTIIENTQTIEIVGVPIPDFSTIEVCEGSVMDFTDISTDVIPSAVYMWDFDNDGIVDSNAKTGVSFTYANQGSHIVKLTISNGFGCTQEIVKQVSVVGLPTPDFAWDIICTGEEVSFNNLSTGVVANATYSWDLDGDGNEDFSTVGDVAYTYSTNGTYDASLIITNATGCPTTITKPIEIVDRPIVALDVIAKCYGQPSQMIDMSQDVSLTATYAWDFENDNTVDDNTVGSTEFTYASYNSYVVTLTVSNGGGCSSFAEKLVVFSDAATPDFTVNKTCQGEEVVFTDLSTNLETGAIYSWDFDGDGAEDGATPGSTFNTFSTAGTYNATLTIDNGGQCLAFKTKELDVTPPPLVDLGLDLNLCNEGLVTFDAGTGYSAYLWPDGTTDQTFTVNKIGDYKVRVQDAKGCFNTDTISVNLLGPPLPAFEHFIELSLEGIKVHFTNNTTNGDTYTWSFGDGSTSDEMDPTHIYSDFSFYETSVYEVCITSTNACEEAQICESIFVSPTAFVEEAGEAIHMYPNPIVSRVTVELDQEEINVNKMGIVNSQGQLVWTTDLIESRNEINMEQLTAGVYFLMVQQKDKLLFKRIIKQ